MNNQEILEKLETIFRSTFNNNALEINELTSANSIPEWDSLNNIYLILNIENEFNIKFQAMDIQDWKNVGDMLESIKKLLS